MNWWPWWVTTLVASTAVLVAALTLARSRRPEIRGAMGGIIVLGVSAAIGAPFVMSGSMDEGSKPGIQDMQPAGSGMPPSAAGRRAPERMPFTFFFTRFEWQGAAQVIYHSDGTPIARSPSGSTLALTGNGGWDPVSAAAGGGGRYLVRGRGGKAVVRGKWRALRFISFTQLPGWLPAETQEDGWQGPRGSAAFTGILKLAVALESHGRGVLTAWCVMSSDAQQAAGRWWDGVTLVGPRLRFTNFKANEGREAGGVMFYGPGTTGA